MKIYHLILKGGGERSVRADGYWERDHELILHVGNQPIEHVEGRTVIMVDDQGDVPGFLTFSTSRRSSIR